jgi:hypothetical protein
VQELLCERGIDVTHEAIRQWCLKFGQDYANQLIRALGPNHGPRASSVRAELVGCQAEKCLLLPGDDISPKKLTTPPVAIECVRNIWREALASFWEACHVAKQNVTKPDHIWVGVY